MGEESRRGGGAAGAITSLLGTPVVSGFWRRARRGLRIITYHEVSDARAFTAQVDHIARNHRVVSGAEVAAAIHDRGPSVDGAVWVTFDDADPTVPRTALPILAERGIPATLYACPGLIDPPSTPWWTVVREAGLRGEGAEVGGRPLIGNDLVLALKRVADAERREVVDRLRGPRPEDATEPTEVADLDRWIAAGMEVGNHSWDHPCLDRCSETEQEEQVLRAHDWLAGYLGEAPTTFAYPNGDRTDHVAGLLDRLGYRTVLLYDHAVARPVAGSAELSRLRLDAHAPIARARAITSGAHSDAMAAGARIARRVRRG